MDRLHEVTLESKSLTPFIDILGPSEIEDLKRVAAVLGRRLDRRVIWNVNSTAAGGGVAEMLHSLLAYARGLGIDIRWAVTEGTPAFFRVTKRLHNALHGDRGDGSSLDDEAREIYRRVTADNARRFATQVAPGDIVLLHDPQTAGLIPRLVALGAHVVWRCHIGSDARSAEVDHGWAFLEPYLRRAHAFVFSRQAYVPEVCDHGKSVIVPPTIDPFSPKNQHLEADVVRSILVEIGLLAGGAPTEPAYVREDGTAATVRRQAEVLRDGPARPASRAQVVQVSRWDPG